MRSSGSIAARDHRLLCAIPLQRKSNSLIIFLAVAMIFIQPLGYNHPTFKPAINLKE
jgi:hypothetical protein